MRALSAGELLTVWELGAAQRPGERVLTLLAAACTTETSPAEIASLTLGQGDDRLLTLRERMFGPWLAALCACPACRETLEFEIDTASVRVPQPAERADLFELNQDGYEVRFRLPTQLDIASLDPEMDVRTNRQELLNRCVVAARHGGNEIPADQLPAEIGAAISDRMAQADPQGDVQLALNCPQCGYGWRSSLDVVSFLWSEINAWALRLLRDIHSLASAYGWREEEILALSATRRQAYLDLIG